MKPMSVAVALGVAASAAFSGAVPSADGHERRQPTVIAARQASASASAGSVGVSDRGDVGLYLYLHETVISAGPRAVLVPWPDAARQTD